MTKIKEIDVNKKYIIQVSPHVEEEDVRKFSRQLKEWLGKEDSPFIVVFGDLTLVKVKQ